MICSGCAGPYGERIKMESFYCKFFLVSSRQPGLYGKNKKVESLYRAIFLISSRQPGLYEKNIKVESLTKPTSNQKWGPAFAVPHFVRKNMYHLHPIYSFISEDFHSRRKCLLLHSDLHLHLPSIQSGDHILFLRSYKYQDIRLRIRRCSLFLLLQP